MIITTHPNLIEAHGAGRELLGAIVTQNHPTAIHVSHIWTHPKHPHILARMMLAFRKRDAGNTVHFERSDDNIQMLRLCDLLNATETDNGLFEFKMPQRR